jgi:hypothetical protein
MYVRYAMEKDGIEIIMAFGIDVQSVHVVLIDPIGIIRNIL